MSKYKCILCKDDIHPFSKEDCEGYLMQMSVCVNDGGIKEASEKLDEIYYENEKLYSQKLQIYFHLDDDVYLQNVCKNCFEKWRYNGSIPPKEHDKNI